MGATKKERSRLVKFADDFASPKPTLKGRLAVAFLAIVAPIEIAAALDAFQTAQSDDIAQKAYNSEMAAFKIAQEEFELAVIEYFKPKPVFESKSIVLEENGKAKTQIVDSYGIPITVVTSRTHKLAEQKPAETENFSLIEPKPPQPYTAPAEWHPQTLAENIVLPGRWLGKALYDLTHQPS